MKEFQKQRSRKNFLLCKEYPSLDLTSTVKCSGGSWVLGSTTSSPILAHFSLPAADGGFRDIQAIIPETW